MQSGNYGSEVLFCAYYRSAFAMIQKLSQALRRGRHIEFNRYSPRFQHTEIGDYVFKGILGDNCHPITGRYSLVRQKSGKPVGLIVQILIAHPFALVPDNPLFRVSRGRFG